MSTLLPHIYRDSQRLLQHTEALVQRFSRYHKYTVGADLRRQAFAVMRRVHRAVYDKAEQARRRFDAVSPVDVAKLQALLGSYWGHFSHANSVQLRHAIFAKLPWLADYFTLQPDGCLVLRRVARWQVLRRRNVLHILNPQGEPR